MYLSRLFGIVLCLFSLPQIGCMSFGELLGKQKSPTLDTSYLKAQGYSIPPGGMPAPVNPKQARGPAVVLEIRGDDTHLESIPVPMDKAIFIEDLVQQAHLHEKLGALSISIMRPTGGNAPPVRLEVALDSAGKAKSIGQNYALLPGDHIIAIHDSRTYLERFIEDSIKATIK